MATENGSISESLYNFQSALIENGQNLQTFMKEHYIDKWMSDEMFHVMAIRTTMVQTMHNYLISKGLFNIEKVSLGPVTDPLAHDVEHTPTIRYKGHQYTTTHSMIYNKFLACFNKAIKGIFVDSPNIRLEIQSATGVQRNKYLIDFSQMDVEMRRDSQLTISDYLNKTEEVKKVLRNDMDAALSLFEGMIVSIVTELLDRNQKDLDALGVRLEIPKCPFPRYRKDEAVARFGASSLEEKIGEDCKSQFFWITGLLRENYDLVYPYLLADGKKINTSSIPSDMIYNYDLCACSLSTDLKRGKAYEVLSGAVREWLYEPIVERLLDNKIIPVRPVIKDGVLENINELGGYGPFLLAVAQLDSKGNGLFPSTYGGGLGIERFLFSVLKGQKIKNIDQITCFGKNPDSHPMYLF